MHSLIHKIIIRAILVLPIIFTACTSSTELVFVTHPEGATITEMGTGITIGTAPTNKLFDLDSIGSVDEEGCYTLNGVEAQWVSGAKEQITGLQLCGKHRRGYIVTLVRPSSYPDLEKDIEVANDLQARVDRAEWRDRILRNTSIRQAEIEGRYSVMSQQPRAERQ